jgi:hypothetical protein
MKRFILTVVLFAGAMTATASESTSREINNTGIPQQTVESCQKEVAFNALQLVNAISMSELDAQIDVKPGDVENDGKSASAYVVPVATGGNVLVLGKDVWTVPAHRSLKGKKETFVIQATTTTSQSGECRVLAMTLVDHITGR